MHDERGERGVNDRSEARTDPEVGVRAAVEAEQVVLEGDDLLQVDADRREQA